MELAFSITPSALEQLLGSIIVIGLLGLLAWAIRKFIGE
jgi:flagellar biogenesis protein FliO